MAIGRDEPELAREQSLDECIAALDQANRCRTHCSTWPSGKPFHGVTLTFLTGLTVHCTGAHELNTWQTSRADRAKCCNQCFCNGCLSKQEENICVRRFPICPTYYGKIFVMIPSPSFVPTPLPEPITDAEPITGAWEAEHMVTTSEVRTTIVSTTDVVIACVSITMKRLWNAMQSFSL